ncbi:ATPase, partial [Nocardia salmonicida]
VRVFRELRSGITADGRTKLKSPSGTLSTAEAISVITNGLALSAHFGDGVLRASDIAGAVLGSVIKDPVADTVIWTEYLEAVVRERPDWADFYRACREIAG